jgi:hypothetical protein
MWHFRQRFSLLRRSPRSRFGGGYWSRFALAALVFLGFVLNCALSAFVSGVYDRLQGD